MPEWKLPLKLCQALPGYNVILLIIKNINNDIDLVKRYYNNLKRLMWWSCPLFHILQHIIIHFGTKRTNYKKLIFTLITMAHFYTNQHGCGWRSCSSKNTHFYKKKSFKNVKFTIITLEQASYLIYRYKMPPSTWPKAWELPRKCRQWQSTPLTWPKVNYSSH